MFSPQEWRGKVKQTPEAVILHLSLLESNWEAAGITDGTGCASLLMKYVALCQLNALVRLVCHFSNQIAFGTEGCLFFQLFFLYCSLLSCPKGYGHQPAPPIENVLSPKGDILMDSTPYKLW